MTTYDAIIVLGGGRDNDGSLTELSKQRLDAGIELFKKGVAPKIFALGGKYSTYRPGAIYFSKTGAQMRKDYLIDKDIPEEKIVLVKDGKDTIGEAFACRSKSKELGFYNLMLVTSDKHLSRALLIFKRIFGDKYKIEGFGVPCGDFLEEEEEAYKQTFLNYFEKFPENIPEPNLKTWVEDNPILYERYQQIHDKFHPSGHESQAYAGVKR